MIEIGRLYHYCLLLLVRILSRNEQFSYGRNLRTGFRPALGCFTQEQGGHFACKDFCETFLATRSFTIIINE
jgi:hypothetical protein